MAPGIFGSYGVYYIRKLGFKKEAISVSMFLGYMQGIMFRDETLKLVVLDNRHYELKNRTIPPMNSVRTYTRAERNLMDELIIPRFSYEEKIYGLEE